MNGTKGIIPVIALLMLVFICTAQAEGFEGKIEYRDISLMTDAFPSLSEFMDDHSVEFHNALRALFSKTPDELKEIAMDNGGNEFVEETNSTIYMKGDLYRIDETDDDGKQSIIYDLKSKTMKIIRWDEKAVMVSSMNKMEDIVQLPPEMQDMETEREKDLFSMQKANQTKTVAGYKCELYTGTNSDGDYTHLWITDQNQSLVNSFLNIMKLFQDSFGESELKDAEDKFFIQKKAFDLLRYSGSAFSVDIEQVQEISEEPIDQNMFETPAGFKELSMEELMKEEMEMDQDDMEF